METATPKQRALLKKLMLSGTFTDQEVARTTVQLNCPGITKAEASELINWALAHINDRDQDKKASSDRKATYHKNKGEYPLRRYSNNNPPPIEQTEQTEQTEQAEPKIYRINGVDYTDKNEAAAAASKAIFG